MTKTLKQFTIEKSLINSITIIFSNKDDLLIEQIIISNPNENSWEIALEKYGELPEEHPGEIVKEIENYLNGKEFNFSLEYLNLDKCTDFQKSVLIKEFESEYGSTNSYGELAELAGHPRAARAVGTTLAMNPFPLIIPCHRTIRHNKSIGQFGGGVESKMKLLELEKNNL